MSTTQTIPTKERGPMDNEKKETKVKVAGPGPSYLDHHFRSSLNTGPRKTPTIPNGGVWSVYAETDIPTPHNYPYQAIIQIHSWRDWNTFVPDVLVTKHPNSHSRTIKMEQGTFMTFTVQLTPSERVQTKTVCQHLEPLKHRADGHKSHVAGHNITRIRWTSDNANLLTPGFVLKQECVNEIEENDDGTCKYRTWLTFAGMASKNLKKKFGEAYQQKMQDFVRDLRERCVQLYEEDKKRGTVDLGAGKAGAGGERMQPVTEIHSSTTA
ncbi:hypothetical protein M409DRAFT_18890 [Zasmidium cellare ATCC 36951]|uniref:VASt domain-containing protein n=1 Tax=Zasmidium cellare ATCC 36951 TaxID=1080233 RepID=A0A6A6CYN6_ZASCE|nr:uncharacterized protein M409DRAFT_18890 [Zasmidium cellare ATCC 36951]KAF2170919.1 hypothetical protein M409DRAFT_18890 [Zasmidium cellare ATCC 36951]